MPVSADEDPAPVRPDDAPTAPASDPAPHTTAAKLADLSRRFDEHVHAGSAKAVERQHARGKKTARERIDLLLDAGSFVEFDAFARHRSTNFGLAANRPYGDGVVTGYGTVNGREICVFSQDVAVFGGSLGEVYGEKIVKVMDFALRTGRPIVGINEGGGARIQEGVVSLGLYAEIFKRNVHASGVIPQISLIMGAAAGGHVYSPALTDFVVMVDKTSQMFITGPDVVRTVTGEEVTLEELGGARTHNTRSGNAHYLGADEDDAIGYVRDLLGYLPSNNLSTAPTLDVDTDNRTQRRRSRAEHTHPGFGQPALRHGRGGLRRARRRRVPAGARPFAPNIIIGFGRVAGRSVGIVANQPRHLAGTLDINASEKAARFVRTCDSFNIPVLTFVDVPGFLPGTDQEWNGIIRRGAKLIYAYAEATVPLITVITRKAYGGAYDVMGSKHLGADVNVAWPTAQIAVMGAQGAVNILYRKEIGRARGAGRGRAEIAALRSRLQTEYEDTLANPFIAAERGYVDQVIDPAETRGRSPGRCGCWPTSDRRCRRANTGTFPYERRHCERRWRRPGAPGREPGRRGRRRAGGGAGRADRAPRVRTGAPAHRLGGCGAPSAASTDPAGTAGGHRDCRHDRPCAAHRDPRVSVAGPARGAAGRGIDPVVAGVRGGRGRGGRPVG